MPSQSDGDVWGGDSDIVLGIDQSYTGFAITAYSADGYETECRALRGEGDERLDDAENIVGLWIARCEDRLAEVAMEGYAYGASQNAHMAGELGAVVRRKIRELTSILPLRPSPAQVKKYATGKGNAKKAEMLLAVYKNWDIEFNNDNMADSFTIAKIASGEGRNKHQKDVVELVIKNRGAK